MVKRIIIISFLIGLLRIAQAEENYTIQVKAVPIGQKASADKIAANLRKAFRFVFLSQTQNDQPYIQIRHGVFHSYTQAKERAEFLKQDFGGYDYIDKLSTPLIDVIRQEKTISKSILKCFRNKLEYYTKEFNSSPDSSALIIQDKYSIYVLNLCEQNLSLIGQRNNLDGFFTTPPQWSFDSQFVGYFDFINSDYLTNLYVAKKDGSQLIKIDPSKTNDENVFKYCWHPNQLGIIYIYGYCWGSATSSGNLCYIDLHGNKSVLISTSQKNLLQVSSRKLFIKKEYIHFDFVKYDENLQYRTFWPDSFKLTSIPKQ